MQTSTPLFNYLTFFSERQETHCLYANTSSTEGNDLAGKTLATQARDQSSDP